MTSRRIVAALAVVSLFAVPELADASPSSPQGSARSRRATPRQHPASATAPATDRPFDLDVSTTVRHFSWTETRQDGSQFVNESGMLFVIGATPKLSLGRERRIVVETGLEMYFGSVGYNGGVQA